MNSRFRRLATSLTLLAVLAGLVSASPVGAAPPGTPPEGSAVITPANGNASTLFDFVPDPSPAFCPGDTGTDGYTWQTFMAPASIDPATITYGGVGPITTAGDFPQPLYSGSTPIINNGLAASTGQIVGAPANYSFGILPAGFVPGGVYNIGFACTLAGVTETFWTTPITITVDGGGAITAYAQGAVAAAPTLDSLTPASGELTANFTPGLSDPAATSFTATATPQGGGATETATGAASPLTITGLVNGTAYDVVVTATNSVGTSADSNTIAGTPAVAGQPAVQSLIAVPGAVAGDIDVSWLAPANAGTLPPVGYTLTVVPADAGPFTLGSGVLSQTVSGLTAGTPYTFTVEANYSAPDFGTPTSVTAVPSAAQVLNQEITVERPAGALILTQRCGVYNALPAYTAVDAFPGYPFGLANDVGTVDQVGTSPDIDLGTPGVQVDPEFGNYPFPSPATYPTQCGLDLGTAQFVTTGALAGQYYAADGALNEVTVVDTRDVDAGWTVSGTMGTFTAGTESFSGNYLGWEPVVTDDSDATGTGYDQAVAAGAAVLPGSGVAGGTGLGSVGGQPLAAALAGEGLGIATLDARVALLIPAEVNAGSYSGILALTVI